MEKILAIAEMKSVCNNIFATFKSLEAQISRRPSPSLGFPTSANKTFPPLYLILHSLQSPLLSWASISVEKLEQLGNYWQCKVFYTSTHLEIHPSQSDHIATSVFGVLFHCYKSGGTPESRHQSKIDNIVLCSKRNTPHCNKAREEKNPNLLTYYKIGMLNFWGMSM